MYPANSKPGIHGRSAKTPEPIDSYQAMQGYLWGHSNQGLLQAVDFNSLKEDAYSTFLMIFRILIMLL